VSDISYSPEPVEARGLEDVVKVSDGAHHALALHRDSTVSVWGWNYELLDKQSRPRPLSGIRGIVDIDAGIHFNLVLKQ
jgi:alpha-tubulin suppressor-like RCC1 family protein